jgi:hypothetical protein
VFFWSEEEARAERQEGHRVDGTYLTMSQAAYATRVGQASLFDLDFETGRPRR